MIEFTILYTIITGGTITNEREESYTAIEGMTWGDWCESKYNTTGFEVVNNKVQSISYLYLNNGYVYGTDVIQPTQYSYTTPDGYDGQ